MKRAQKEPDWKRIGAAADQAEADYRSGRATYESWRALVAEADAAGFGDLQYSEALFYWAESEWLKKLFSETRQERRRRIA